MTINGKSYPNKVQLEIGGIFDRLPYYNPWQLGMMALNNSESAYPIYGRSIVAINVVSIHKCFIKLGEHTEKPLEDKSTSVVIVVYGDMVNLGLVVNPK